MTKKSRSMVMALAAGCSSQSTPSWLAREGGGGGGVGGGPVTLTQGSPFHSSSCASSCALVIYKVGMGREGGEGEEG